MKEPTPKPSDARAEAMEVVEHARESAQSHPSFAAGLFLGSLQSTLVYPFPEQDATDRAEADALLRELETVLRQEIDPDAVDRDREIPARAMARLREIGAFRLKIPKQYGGLGFSQTNYNRTVALVGSWCGSTAIWMSGHQSIGVSTPLKLFGTKEQKDKYLPAMAADKLSAFALTEPEAGSDPARMQTRATPADDGEGWILNGEKLWCTNGPKADTIIVMARTPEKVIGGKPRPQISAFIVDTDDPGFEVVHRCDFMGYGGIHSGLLRFNDVRVPKENLLWKEGHGLKLALITLNTGRLTLPATNTAVAKTCLRIVRQWAGRREQWGQKIGELEAVAVQLGWIAAHAFAMESFSDYAAALADDGESDIRIEAAMAKLFCSEMVFAIADRTVQIRGGRGYETAESLRARGEIDAPVERIFREARLNRIVEGTSEVMRLFLAREALDPHLRKAGAFAKPSAPFGARAKAFLKCAVIYPGWYLKRWLPTFGTPADMPPTLKKHWRYVRRGSQRLARRIFHAMVRFGPKLEHRQALVGRVVDEGTELTAMAASIARAASRGDAPSIELADLYCRYARTRIQDNRRHRYSVDVCSRRVAHRAVEGRYVGVEEGIMPESNDPK